MQEIQKSIENFQKFNFESITYGKNGETNYIGGVLMERRGMCHGLSVYYALHHRGDLKGTLPNESFIDYFKRLCEKANTNEQSEETESKSFFEGLLYAQLRNFSGGEKIRYEELINLNHSFGELINEKLNRDVRVVGISLNKGNSENLHIIAVKIKIQNGIKYDLFDGYKGEYRDLNDTELREKIKVLYQHKNYKNFRLIDLLALHDKQRDNPVGFVARDIKMLKFLKKNIKGLDFNQLNVSGATYVNLAIRDNDKERLEYLFENGAEPNLRSNTGNSSLDTAIFYGNENMIKLLLAYGAIPTFTNLFDACEKFSLKTYNLLLKHFLKVTDIGKLREENIPVTFLLLNHYLKIDNNGGIRSILSKDINLEDKYLEFLKENIIGKYNFATFITSPKVEDIAKLRKRYIPAIFLLLDQYIETGNIKLISSKSIGLEAKCLLNLIDKAIKKSNPEIFQLLLNQISGINCDELSINNILSTTILKNNVPFTELLLNKGANPNKLSGKVTPLTLAIRTENVEIIKLLLEHGADASREGDSDRAKTLRAELKRHPEMKKVLDDFAASKAPGNYAERVLSARAQEGVEIGGSGRGN